MQNTWGSNLKSEDTILIIILIVIIIIIIYMMNKSKNSSKKEKYEDIDYSYIQPYGTNVVDYFPYFVYSGAPYIYPYIYPYSYSYPYLQPYVYV